MINLVKLAPWSALISSIYIDIFINIGVPLILFFFYIKKEKKNFLLILISILLIPINIFISFMALWILGNVMLFNNLIILFIPFSLFFVFKRKYYSAILICKIAEVIVIYLGSTGGYLIN